jgi:two-component system, NtrC family, sensor kinase
VSGVPGTIEALEHEVGELRQKLAEAEQLAAVGLTVAGLAHTVKNILNGLEGSMYMIDTGLGKGDLERVKTGWGMVKRYVDQVSTLTRNLLSYARPRVLERRPLDPGELVRAAAALYADKAELAGIKLETEVQPGLPRVLADEEALHACLGNLVTNALDACTWDPDVDREHRIKLSASSSSAGGVSLQVQDNGMGISEENQRKLLSSIFTTKGMRGTGLGVLLTRRAVEAHAGRLWFLSAEGQGTTFVIELPAAPGAP